MKRDFASVCRVGSSQFNNYSHALQRIVARGFAHKLSGKTWETSRPRSKSRFNRSKRQNIFKLINVQIYKHLRNIEHLLHHSLEMFFFYTRNDNSNVSKSLRSKSFIESILESVMISEETKTKDFLLKITSISCKVQYWKIIDIILNC